MTDERRTFAEIQAEQSTSGLVDPADLAIPDLTDGEKAAFLMTDGEVWADFLNMPFRFWICPVEGHSDSRLDGDGVPAETVRWEGNVAHCTWPGCGRTSAGEWKAAE